MKIPEAILTLKHKFSDIYAFGFFPIVSVDANILSVESLGIKQSEMPSIFDNVNLFEM